MVERAVEEGTPLLHGPANIAADDEERQTAWPSFVGLGLMGVAVAATLVLAVATTVSNTSNAVVTHPMASSSSAQWTVGSGETFLTNVDGLFISEKTITCTLTSATGTATGKCLKMTTTTLANHEMGPWCTGGFWDKKNVVFPQKSALISSCMCQRYDCDGTCSDMCMECTPIAHERTYIIPLSPVVESADRYAPVVATTSRSTQLPLFTPLPLDSSALLLGAHDDNNFGDGLALNGVPLAKADPYSELTDQNNIAPLDPNGGHSTLQLTYHYHAIPTIFFTCQTGYAVPSQTGLT